MNLKYSRQREAIKNFMMSRKDHPTADTVYMHVRQEFPNISLGTVYRNLTLLSEMGELQRLRVGDGIDHFDAELDPHYHFICDECGAVLDINLPTKGTIISEANSCFDGEVNRHITYFYGRCKACKEKKALQLS